MLSRFFIDRPIFATVLSLLITLAGGLAVWQLPVAQFPRVAPPIVSVSCNYPGASALDVSTAVAAPIEQQVNGVEGMMYMSSSSTNDGGYNLTVTFKQGIDLNMAQVLVQNRVALALPNLPDVIKQSTVSVRKRSPDPVMGFAIVSPEGSRDQLYLSGYTLKNIREELARIPGVSDIMILAQRDYSMRIWVNPNRLAVRGLTASDLIAAIRDQNQQLVLGSVGQEPTPTGQMHTYTLDGIGRLDSVEQFENILIRSTRDGKLVRLKDVARLELRARNEDIVCRFDRKVAAFLMVFQLPDANALDLRNKLLAKMDELRPSFPPDLAVEISFDTTPYTAESINEVFKTLRDAVILVALVVLLFLQNWRSAIIPLAAVPVAIIGTFAVMLGFGFGINNLTLFGLVLAIGIVVDDAIVVVEAVEHHIEEGHSPREATLLAMKQVSGPVIAVGLVLSAVFIPCAFISGITGLFFRQFALTIAAGTLISTLNSLTLSPALAALLLRPHEGKRAAPPLPRLAYLLAGGWLTLTFLGPIVQPHLPAHLHDWPLSVSMIAGGIVLGWLASWPINAALRLLFRGFNAGFRLAGVAYVWTVGIGLRLTLVVLALYAFLVMHTADRMAATPKGFIPNQDMGYLLVSVQLPDSASLERTEQVMWELQEIALSIPGVRHVTTISGNSFALSAAGSNFGSMFLNLHEFHDRHSADKYSEAIAAKMRAKAGSISDAIVAVFSPPPIRGVGRAGGFSFIVEDRADRGPFALQKEVDNLIRQGGQTKGLGQMLTVFRANVPQVHIEANLEECQLRGVSVTDFTDTLRVFEGSLYVNDFNLFGRTWQVIIQADASFRDELDDLKRLKVRSATGGMVQLGSISEARMVNGPLVLNRYNMYPAAQITGFSAPGVSSREAITLMENLANETLSRGMAYEWTDLSYLELQAGTTAYRLFLFAVAMVFLVLAAQYESWAMPLAVILVVPLCILSAVLGVNIAALTQVEGDWWTQFQGWMSQLFRAPGGEINIFTQVGFVVLVGLASKNAVLIVEYARHLREQGVDRRTATLEACRLRLRPIIMTSLAFILGVLPLVYSTGAGAEMRKALGVAVFSGMIGVTIFGLLLTPIFFSTIDWLGGVRSLNRPAVLLWSGRVLDAVTLGPARRGLAWAWRKMMPSSDGRGEE